MTGDGGSAWSTWVDAAGDAVRRAGQWRSPRVFDAVGPSGTLWPPAGEDGAPAAVVSFASNDYLGLTVHPAVVAAAHAALDRWGTGAGASRLVTGTRPVHHELEAALAGWRRTEAAVVLPTGFAANLAVLTVLGSADAHVFSDELNHASIIDGCRLARAPVTTYAHGDLGGLDAALGRSTGRPLIVSDTVFSMDGDEADLDGLCEVAARHGALLVLDEAHAVLGPDLPERRAGVPVVRVGTLSKTLGALGGYVAGPRAVVDLLVNRGRSYVFTTGLPPADAAAALAALGIVASGEGDRLRRRLAVHVARVAAAVGRPGHRAPILPVVVGGATEALGASAALLDHGLWVPAIRPPTVPVGTSRLRITLSAAHTGDQVDRLVGALAGVAGTAADGGRRGVARAS